MELNTLKLIWIYNSLLPHFLKMYNVPDFVPRTLYLVFDFKEFILYGEVEAERRVLRQPKKLKKKNLYMAYAAELWAGTVESSYVQAFQSAQGWGWFYHYYLWDLGEVTLLNPQLFAHWE